MSETMNRASHHQVAILPSAKKTGSQLCTFNNRPASAVDHRWDEVLSKSPMTIEANVIVLSLEGVDTASHSFSANIVAEFRIWYNSNDLHDFDPKIRCLNLK